MKNGRGLPEARSLGTRPAPRVASYAWKSSLRCVRRIYLIPPHISARTRRSSHTPHNDVREQVSPLHFRISSRNVLEREDGRRNPGTLVPFKFSPKSCKRTWKTVRKIRTWPASSLSSVIAPDWAYPSSPTTLQQSDAASVGVDTYEQGHVVQWAHFRVVSFLKRH